MAVFDTPLSVQQVLLHHDTTSTSLRWRNILRSKSSNLKSTKCLLKAEYPFGPLPAPIHYWSQILLRLINQATRRMTPTMKMHGDNLQHHFFVADFANDFVRCLLFLSLSIYCQAYVQHQQTLPQHVCAFLTSSKGIYHFPPRKKHEKTMVCQEFPQIFSFQSSHH